MEIIKRKDYWWHSGTHGHFRSGRWETCKVNAGDKHNIVKEVKDLRERERLIDGGKLEVMKVARGVHSSRGYREEWRRVCFANSCHLMTLKTRLAYIAETDGETNTNLMI